MPTYLSRDVYDEWLFSGSWRALTGHHNLLLSRRASGDAPRPALVSRVASNCRNSANFSENDRQTGGECRFENRCATSRSRQLRHACASIVADCLTTSSHDNAAPACAIGRRRNYLKSAADQSSITYVVGNRARLILILAVMGSQSLPDAGASCQPVLSHCPPRLTNTSVASPFSVLVLPPCSTSSSYDV